MPRWPTSLSTLYILEMGFSDEFLRSFNIYLGSRSPRREQLLKGLGVDFKVWLKNDIDESYNPGLHPHQVAESLARHKAAPYEGELKNDDILITADTIVAVDNRILGKPDTRDKAFKSLEALSGREHNVITGVCLSSADKCHCFYADTLVKFAALEKSEIEFYIDNYEPFDKAGAYGIQEWIGFIGVESINGSYFNVMGLPVHSLYHELKFFTGYYSK